MKRDKTTPVVLLIAVLALIAPYFITNARANQQHQIEAKQQEQLRIQREIEDLKHQNEDLKAQLQVRANAKAHQVAIEAAQATATTKAAQTPTIPVTTPQIVIPGNCDAYRPLVAQYNWNVAVAMAVMNAESGCNPAAQHTNDDGSVDHGLFQLNNQNVHDPAANVAIAFTMYSRRGWQPWSVCRLKVRCY